MSDWNDLDIDPEQDSDDTSAPWHPPVESPRLSVIKLAEYCTAGPAEQEKILIDCKFPSPYNTPYYNTAKAINRHWLVSRMNAKDKIDEKIEYLQKELDNNPDFTRQKISRLENNIIALQSIAKTNYFPPIDARTLFRQIPHNQNKSTIITIHGVAISVRPDIVTELTLKNKNTNIGAIYSIFGQDFNINATFIGVVAGIVGKYLEHEGYINESQNRKLHYPHCFLFDVLNEKIHPGPTSAKRINKEIEAACRAIATRWPTLTAP